MNILQNYPKRLPVYLNPEAFKRKIAVFDGPDGRVEVEIGMPFEKHEYEKEGCIFNPVGGFSRITGRIYAISNIKREPGWKSWDERLKQKNGADIIDDPFDDDLSLLVETDLGPVVLLGCAHAGVVEILDNIKEETGLNEFYAVIGGTHLGSASSDYINEAVNSLREYKVRIIGTSHCTGFNVSCHLASIFKDIFVNASVGSVFEL